MTTPYYTVTGVPVAAARGLSSPLRSEYALIAAGFATAQTDILARGIKTGDTWSGSHDFTGAVLTAATQSLGDSSTKVATTAFVAAQAFSTTLPNQSGNAGKSLITDGTSASWGAIGVLGGGTGLSTYTTGDLLYASGTSTLSKLAGVATGNALISGGVGAAPTWGKVGLTTHVSGTLSPANGGTGVANNSASTITISGAFGLTMTLTNTTSLTLPTSGTLATLTGTETLTNKTIMSPAISGGTIDNAAVGATTRSTGAFTTLTANGATTLTAGLTVTGKAVTTPVAVAFSATPTFDASASNVQTFGALTANVTAVTVSSPTDGQTLNLRFVQDGTGGRTVTLGSSFSVVGSINTTASKVSWLSVTYSSLSSKWEGAWTALP